MSFLVDAYTEEETVGARGKPETRVVLKLHPALAPVKVAILPLSRNERLAPTAREVHDLVRRSGAITASSSTTTHRASADATAARTK